MSNIKIEPTTMSNVNTPLNPPAELQRPKDKKLRSACDACHQSKVKCTGERDLCSRCRANGLPCNYSFATRAGKPKGSRNRKTLEKLERLKAEMNIRQSPAQVNSAGSPREQDSKAGSSSAVGDQFNNFSLPQNIDDFLASPERFVDLEVFSETAPSSSGSPAPSLHPSPTFPSNHYPLHRKMENTHIDSSPNVSYGHSSAYPNLPSEGRVNATNRAEPNPYYHASMNQQNTYDSLVRPMDFLSPMSSTNSPSATGHSSTESIPLMGAGLCACFQDQTSNLNKLHAIKHSVSLQHFDIILETTNTIVDACRAFLSCTCVKDAPGLLLTVTTLQLIVELLQIIIRQQNEAVSHGAGKKVDLGDIEMSLEEERELKRLFIQRAMGKVQETLNGFRATVHSLCGRNTGDGAETAVIETAEIRYFSETMRRLQRVLVFYLEEPIRMGGV